MSLEGSACFPLYPLTFNIPAQIQQAACASLEILRKSREFDALQAGEDREEEEDKEGL